MELQKEVTIKEVDIKQLRCCMSKLSIITVFFAKRLRAGAQKAKSFSHLGNGNQPPRETDSKMDAKGSIENNMKRGKSIPSRVLILECVGDGLKTMASIAPEAQCAECARNQGDAPIANCEEDAALCCGCKVC